MKNRAMICRALSGHALEVKGPIVVVQNDARRITFYCERCDSWRVDTWSKDGRVIEARSYKLSDDYHKFVKEHNRAEARGSLLATQKETKHETDNSSMRLVRGTSKANRRRPTHSRKRPRDKRRAAR